jgi:sarcosine oxidase subunit beta
MSGAAQFIVVGSGVIGASIAYHLARRGAAVTLLDAAEPAVAPSASWASAGGLRSQGRHGPERAISMAAAARWPTLSEELEADLACGFGGHLHVAETAAEEPAIEARLQADRAAGIAIERVDSAAMRAIAPALGQHLRLGAFTAGDGQANPALVSRAFARAAQNHGAQLRLNTAVRPHMGRGGVQGVRLPDGDVLRAERVILAAGAWSVAWLREIGIHLPLRWRGLQMLVSDPVPVRLDPTVTAVGRNLSLKQTPSGGIMIGGRWFGRPAGAPPAVEPIPDHVPRQWAGAQSILPCLAQSRLQSSWAGAEAQTLDGMPFIGATDSGGLYLATGFSNHGFQISPAIGALVADDLLLGPQPMLTPFHPARAGDANVSWSHFENETLEL